MSSEEEEVAEDYRTALEELSPSNNRTEIINLTSIARDYTAHALKIAEVLQQHILKAAPNKKLPALYVLDSIVKNVGTPYTLYLGRNIFKTFMESYAVAGPEVRRRMEEMLKTWTQPVTGSLDTRPVFNPDLIRPIENALMKYKQATMTQAPIPGRPRSAVPGQRDTPTPPGGRAFGRPTGGHPSIHPNGHTGPYAMHPGNAQQQMTYPNNTTPQPAQPAQPAYPYQTPAQGPQVSSVGGSNEALSRDIANLIVAMKAEQAQNPGDASIQPRLKALGDLQGIMQASTLPPDQLELIRNKVTELAAVTMRALSATPNNVPPPHARPTPPQSQPIAPPPVASTPSQGGVSLDSLLGPGALAALMARGSSATPQNSTPQPPAPAYPGAVIRSPQPPPAQPYQPPAASSAPNPMALLDQLRQAGLLKTPVNAAPTATPPPAQPAQPVIPASIAQLLASRVNGSQGMPVPAPGMIDIASLKGPFRQDIVAQLYDGSGPPCTQCGRRFKTDEEGKKKKAAHMDWHFRVHQRSNEAEQRGMHRSWYVDEKDWLKSREVVDADQVAAADQASAEEAAKAAEAARPTYITAPNAGSGINNVCPICQERFENKWLDEAQEWVWLDAVLVKGRAFHWSCHKEATRDREGTPGADTSILGKRKAETSISSPKVRSLKTYA
ncbi:mRNA cleavage factor complex component Pcf11 [Sarocladium implicatum]|nr:mRNA cleavage factor complex component Pcf11 [Sarocladium implicatum]